MRIQRGIYWINLMNSELIIYFHTKYFIEVEKLNQSEFLDSLSIQCGKLWLIMFMTSASIRPESRHGSLDFDRIKLTGEPYMIILLALGLGSK